MDIPFLASIFGKHEFVVRRVHSLLGLIPIGGFLAFHLATNASILDGADTYQMRVRQHLSRLAPQPLPSWNGARFICRSCCTA